MKLYIYSVQFVSEETNYEIAVDRGFLMANSYMEAVKEIETERKQKNESIIDLYIIANDKSILHISEETYDKLLNGDMI